ncbi:ScbR family autoregulator-binding transcription factor [Actinocrispum wychmicini]|uniref:TetR family transcriptional regulator n=1 Tax=Actinocrispum wychmicini TaxID=1213861 RepID=A0A4R2IYJ6_9PSEU|nr:ScbR family autoregulator-binding transcription factor [Actinocrispum wychmicini]TCO48005.1 TetR family transcriptional regulator [Actinocrispum wychmicini]
MSKRNGLTTRGNLVAAAAEIFDRDGFAGTSLHEVCARAEVSKGALYCHFPSKSALAVAVIERQSMLWHEVKHDTCARGTSPVQALVDLSFEIAERMRIDPVIRAGCRLVLDAELFDVAAAGQFAGCVMVVRDLLIAAERAGELVPGANVREAAEGIVAELIGTQLLAQAMTGECQLLTRLPAIWRVRLRGLVREHVLAGLCVDRHPVAAWRI